MPTFTCSSAVQVVLLLGVVGGLHPILSRPSTVETIRDPTSPPEVITISPSCCFDSSILYFVQYMEISSTSTQSWNSELEG
ncbi:hypothetical protein BKA60DRAFT_566512 [Fusarium oxysporum]|nr:hypothetical protein BKA60DRAFT_566512 [Fusarium oxysporum]